jgi:hypothetical protein
MKPSFFRHPQSSIISASSENCSDISTDQVSVFTIHLVDLEVVRNLVTASNTSPAVLEVFESSILHLKEDLVS